MMQRSLIFLLVFGAVAASSAAASAAQYEVTQEQVAAAITDHGVQISSDQVTLLTAVVANVANPRLQVQSVDRTGTQRAIARLECADSRQCLPFIVSLRLDQTENTVMALSSSQRPSPAIPQTRPSPVILRAGSPAILLLNGAHVHIRLTVICLDNGTLGQTIRATDRDRRQVYTARVTEDGILEGRL